MSNQAPDDSIFNLEQHFLPAWAKQSPDENRFANYEGETERRGDRRRDRGDRRDRPAERRDRPAGRGPGPSQGPRRRDQRGRDNRGPDDRRRDGPRPPRQDRPAPQPVPLPEINVAFVPDDKGVDSLAKQIKMTGRAYPLFDIAHMILSKPERHSVTFSVCKNAEGNPINPLYLCALDETLWLSAETAMQHLLEKHFTTFYQPERTQVEPPKGTYTFVAQCGMSGVILGPPNHHDYQNQLRKLHAERFSRMPFDTFKARVKIVREETVVKKWIDDQSYKTHYLCLNMPEPLRLETREEAEQHFRETHLPNLVQLVETFRMSGVASRNIRELGLRRLVRQVWEDQRRFPIQVATVLSQQFAASGLQFFKVNKTVTHVAVARPHYLDLEVTPVSEGVRQIVNFINTNPRCTHNQLLEALAPVPGGDDTVEPTPERTAVIADLHWLVHEGHVIEFANGVLETAKKPVVKPPKPAPVPTAPPPAPPSSESTTPVPTATEAGSAVTESAPAASPSPKPQAGAPVPAELTTAGPTPTAIEPAPPSEPKSSESTPVASVEPQSESPAVSESETVKSPEDPPAAAVSPAGSEPAVADTRAMKPTSATNEPSPSSEPEQSPAATSSPEKKQS